MASTIQIKNSTTSGNSPSSLATGELAINVVDGNFFYGSASAVKQDFALGNLTASNTTISGTLSIEGSGSTLFEVVGSEGQLFSITDNLSGSLFAVSDVSGLPILEVFSDDTVKIGSFNNEAITVSGSHTTIGGVLAIPGFNDVSASLAAASAGGDNLGNHTATQNLDMGTYAITNVGNVDGVDVSALNSTVSTNTSNISTNTSDISSIASFTASLDPDITTLSLPASTTISTFGASLIDDTNAGFARSTLGLGTIATQASGDYVSINGDTLQGGLDLGTYNVTNVGELRATTVSGSTFVSDGVTVISTPDVYTVEIGQSAGGVGGMNTSIVANGGTQYGLFSNTGIQLTGSVDISSTLSIPGFTDVSASLASLTSTNYVLSINSEVPDIDGDVSLTTSEISEGSNQYYTDTRVKTKLNADNVVSGSAANVKSFLNISSADISDVDAFSQTGTYASLRAQGTTAGDVGLGNVTNESKATMFTSPTFTGTVAIPGFNDVSASLAAAVAGGDNLGNHTATQNLNMGTYAITNVGNVDGVDVSTLKSDFDTLNNTSKGRITYLYTSSVGAEDNVAANYIHYVDDVIDYILINTSSYNNVDLDGSSTAAYSNFLYNEVGSILTVRNVNNGAFRSFKINNVNTANNGNGDVVRYDIQSLLRDVSSGSLSDGDEVEFIWDKSAGVGGAYGPTVNASAKTFAGFYQGGYNYLDMFFGKVTDTEFDGDPASLSGVTVSSSFANSSYFLPAISQSESLTLGGLTVNGTITANEYVGLPSGLISSSAQVDHDSTTNFNADEHFTQANITTVGTIGTGVWQGTAIADGYISSATTWNNKLDSSGTITTNDYAKFDASGDLIGRSYSEIKTDLSLNNVENTALSTYTGNGGALDNQYITNGAGYTTNTGTVTSVGGTGTVDGLTLSGTVTTSGNLTLGGAISITTSSITNFPTEVSRSAAAAGFGSEGGGGGSSTLSGLSDVNITSIADGDLLRYNGTATEWQNTNLGLSLTPEVSAIEGGYFGGYAKITNWGSYTQPSAQASVVSGSAETLIDTCDISSNGEITWDDSNTTTGERILKVQVQDFGDLASEITTGSYTKSSASYRYFRWYAVSASSNVQIDEFRFYTSENQGGTKYPPNMTSNTAPSPYVAVSSGNYSGYFPYEAFDSLSYSEWWNLASPPYQGAYLSIDLGTSQTIKSMRITHGGSYQSFTVANIQGSSDNTNWDTIHTYTNDPNNPNTSTRNFG